MLQQYLANLEIIFFFTGFYLR